MKVSRSQLFKRVEALTASQKASEILQEDIDRVDARDHIADVYLTLDDDIKGNQHEFYNLEGGRGSGKSSCISLEMVSGIMKDPSHLSNGLAIRKWATTLRLSVFNQIQWAIDVLNVGDYWKSTLNPMQFTFIPTGQVIKLTGLDDPQKLKSIKPEKGYFRFVWFEEFNELQGEMEVRNIQQSVIRGGSLFTVFRSFNPDISRLNWANKFCETPDDRVLTMHTTYKDVPENWLGEAFIDEAERLKEINPRAYQHEYMGIPVGNGSQVFENLEVREISQEEYDHIDKVYCGIDWGFSTDPACFIRVSYEPKTEEIRVLDEIYQTHLSNADLAQMIIDKGFNDEGMEWINYGHGYVEKYQKRPYIICDSAEPKSIADLNRLGLRAGKCTKFQGCVTYRLKWLQHRKIIVDPKRTPNTARELQNYQYDVDKKTGEVLSSVPDANNHGLDALSYALDRQIYSGKNSA